MSPVRIDQEMYKPNMIPNTVTPKNIPDVVPACPAGLAFQKQDFLHSDFTVDGFLSCSMASGNDVGLDHSPAAPTPTVTPANSVLPLDVVRPTAGKESVKIFLTC